MRKISIFPGFLNLFFYYSIFFTSFFGVFLVYVGSSNFRFSDIDDTVKSVVFFDVLYSVFVLLLSIQFSFYFVKSRYKNYISRIDEEDCFFYFFIFKCLLLFNVIYILVLIIVFGKEIPLFKLFLDDEVEQALLLAKKAHYGEGYGWPYISKFFDFLNLFLPLLGLAIYGRWGKFLLTTIISFILSFLYLSFDLQKGPFLLLCLMSLFIFMRFCQRNNFFIYFVFAFLGCFFVIYLYSFFMGKNIFDMIFYVFERPVYGQIQGMYYMYQYYTPSLGAMFSKFYFSSVFMSEIVPPDVFIVDYVYPNSEHVVNVNSFFLGEAWSFLGRWGVYFFPWVVAISVVFYMFYFIIFLMKKNPLLGYLMSFVFFSMLPINQSLQLIIYQKFFIYYLLFFIFPINLLICFYNKFFKKRTRIRSQTPLRSSP